MNFLMDSAKLNPPSWEMWALAGAVAALYGQLVWWMKKLDTRSQSQISKLEKKSESQGLSLMEVHIRAGKAEASAEVAKLSARQPCHLPECPKRSHLTFSVGEASESDHEETPRKRRASGDSRKSQKTDADEI